MGHFPRRYYCRFRKIGRTGKYPSEHLRGIISELTITRYFSCGCRGGVAFGDIYDQSNFCFSWETCERVISHSFIIKPFTGQGCGRLLSVLSIKSYYKKENTKSCSIFGKSPESKAVCKITHLYQNIRSRIEQKIFSKWRRSDSFMIFDIVGGEKEGQQIYWQFTGDFSLFKVNGWM